MNGRREAVDWAGHPELVIGLVTPVGTNTSAVADGLRSALSSWNYASHTIKISSHPKFAAPAPPAESEDDRVRRLIDGGNKWCEDHRSASAVTDLFVSEIRRIRGRLNGLRGDEGDLEKLSGLPVGRQAYILHSLKRPEEVYLLRDIYQEQFVLVGCQPTRAERLANLMSRPLSAPTDEGKRRIAEDLMRRDAEEPSEWGQKVNRTFPLADYFLGTHEQASRFVSLLFGDPRLAPSEGELAMYLAHATSLRSVAGSRVVGAALVRDASVIAVGCNDVPPTEAPDVQLGVDTSRELRRELLHDTLRWLDEAKWLGGAVPEDQAERAAQAEERLRESQLMDVIEYQREVHAEEAAICDAAIRGVATNGADLYVTTYPCHLCFKTALAAGIRLVLYIEPYSKSKAADMFPSSRQKLRPYEGIAPRTYVRAFSRRIAVLPDAGGQLPRDALERAAPVRPLPEVDQIERYLQKEVEAVDRLAEGAET